jgi:predicted dehydrogenase
MDVKFPTKVTSTGGRYHYKGEDDWETPDTQIVNMEFGNDVSMIWEGYSCVRSGIYSSFIGTVFHGEKGSLFIPHGGNYYQIFDLEGKAIKDTRNETVATQQANRTGANDHYLNFIEAIQKGTPVNAPIEAGHKCTLLMQLGNISLRVGRTLHTNPANGHIINDSEAQGYWSRSYEPGWEPRV